MGNVTLQGHEIEATFTTDKAGDYIIECTSFTEYEMWLSPEVNATTLTPMIVWFIISGFLGFAGVILTIIGAVWLYHRSKARKRLIAASTYPGAGYPGGGYPTGGNPNGGPQSAPNQYPPAQYPGTQYPGNPDQYAPNQYPAAPQTQVPPAAQVPPAQVPPAQTDSVQADPAQPYRSSDDPAEPWKRPEEN
ncbi:hypothetical protein [Propionibacterium freudenreichii]|uniref:hypothetical protein n=1 Tax=Propionibacterium freudenreichii TaxID=1744 RepID=UPI0038542210